MSPLVFREDHLPRSQNTAVYSLNPSPSSSADSVAPALTLHVLHSQPRYGLLFDAEFNVALIFCSFAGLLLAISWCVPDSHESTLYSKNQWSSSSHIHDGSVAEIENSYLCFGMVRHICL